MTELNDICDNLEKQFEHNLENIRRIKEGIYTNNIDISYMEYLIRDHDPRYGYIIRVIREQLKPIYDEIVKQQSIE